jgi:hypothetical protein
MQKQWDIALYEVCSTMNEEQTLLEELRMLGYRRRSLKRNKRIDQVIQRLSELTRERVEREKQRSAVPLSHHLAAMDGDPI